MRAMTVTTRLVGMCANRSHVNALRLIVAAHAGGRTDRGIGAEAVAVLTGRWLRDPDRIACMKRRGNLAVAACTQVCGWRREPRVAMAVATRHVRILDVHAVTGTVANGSPHERNVLGHATILGAAAGDEENCDRDDSRRHRCADPIG